MLFLKLVADRLYDDVLQFQNSRVQFVYPTEGAYLSKGEIYFRLFHPLHQLANKFLFYVEMDGQDASLQSVMNASFSLKIGSEGSYFLNACVYDLSTNKCVTEMSNIGFDVLPDSFQPLNVDASRLDYGALRPVGAPFPWDSAIKVIHISDLRQIDGYKMHLLRQLIGIPRTKVYQEVLDLSCDGHNPAQEVNNRPFERMLRTNNLPFTELCLQVPQDKWKDISSWVKDLEKLVSYDAYESIPIPVATVVEPLLKILRGFHVLVLTNGAVEQDTYLAELGRLIGMPVVLMDLGPKGPVMLPYSHRGISAYIAQSLFVKHFPSVVASGVDTILLPPIVNSEAYNYENAKRTCSTFSSPIGPFLGQQPPICNRKRNESPREQVVVTYGGRLDVQKGIGMLVRAIKYFVRHLMDTSCNKFDVRFLIIGKGKFQKRLKKNLVESNLLDTVVFISGFVPNEKLPCILSKSSMVVFPSLFPESFGLVNVEAMFMRLPIIAFGVGGTQDFLLDKRNGEIIADRTAKGLALKMHKMVTNPQLRNQYGANGEELARAKYDSRKLLSRVVSMYEHMCLKFNCF